VHAGVKVGDHLDDGFDRLGDDVAVAVHERHDRRRRSLVKALDLVGVDADAAAIEPCQHDHSATPSIGAWQNEDFHVPVG
jgi:hypothetical protein